MIRKIAVTGPESTGKSSLAEQLASHFATVWVPEYAREYLGRLDRPYVENDLHEIAAGQLAAEDAQAEKASGFLFCDTELLVIRIWSEVKYGRCDPRILERQAERKYDLYLLCDIDLPWEYDPLREHPEMRRYLFDLYYNALAEMGVPFEVIHGTGTERLKNATRVIDNFHF